MKFSLRDIFLGLTIASILLGWYLDRTYQRTCAKEMSWCYLMVSTHLEQHCGTKVARGPTGVYIVGTQNEPPMFYQYHTRFVLPSESNSPNPEDWKGL